MKLGATLLAMLWSTMLLAASPQPTDSFSKECPKLSFTGLYDDVLDFATLQKTIEEQIWKLGLKTNWNITSAASLFSSASWTEFANNADDIASLKRLASIVVPALQKYPTGWFAITGLKSVTLVKNLNVANSLRKAMPDPSDETMFYAMNGDLICDAGMEERVHHEFYHFIENRFHGNMYYHDPDWMKLNPPGFQYGSGGANAYNNGPDWQNIGHPSPGLVTAYAQYAPEEDKAEMFGFLMTDGYAGRLKEWATAADPVLTAKRAYLISFFTKVSAGSMSDKFFDSFTR